MPDKTPDTAPIQHTPKHLVDGEVFDKRHPAASSFAPLQPALGVVADDVEEKGQNLRGGPTASEAQKDNLDQEQILVENYERDLRLKSGVGDVVVTPVEDGVAKAAPASTSDDKPAAARKSTDPRSPEDK